LKTSYPHPIIAREAWPFLAIALLVSLVAAYFFGWWSAPLWLATVFILQFFRDPPREVPDDPLAVVSPQLLVHGTQGLRVADASVMPEVTSGNTQAACFVIGEKAASFILAG